METHRRTGLSFERIALSLFARAQAQLKREDMSWVLPEASEEEREQEWQRIEELKDENARGQEHGFWVGLGE